MTDLGWLPPTILSAGTLVVSVAVYRRQRRQARGVKWWSVRRVGAAPNGRPRLELTNTGIELARRVRVELSPAPLGEPAMRELGDIALGAKRTVSWLTAWSEPGPTLVTVRWRSWWRERSWTSEL